MYIAGAHERTPIVFVQTTPATVFGLLGEGVLPPFDLAQSIANVEEALAGRLTPTAVTTRSQSKRHAGSSPEWLPDTFISQIWCNSLMLTSQLDLSGETVNTLTLSGFLPMLIGSHQTKADAGTLVDGTHLMPSVFDSNGSGRQSNPVGNATAADGAELRIGTLELSLLRSENGTVSVGRAPWPPQYVLEHVATEEGMVIVSSVNCGYLDFAINFLRAARNVNGDVKVSGCPKARIVFVCFTFQ